MLKILKFKEDFRCWKAGDQVQFIPGVNLLVGEQGTGKSSLLQAIAAASSNKKYTYPMGLEDKVAVVSTPIKTGGFDFEKNNTRTLGYFGDNMAFQVRSMFRSHGQTNLDMLKAMSEGENTLFFLDEPDMALSIRSITLAVELFRKAVDKGCQIIAAVHNPFMIWSFPVVFSCEKKMWISSREYVNSQYEDHAAPDDIPNL
jgi:predicted ATPase